MIGRFVTAFSLLFFTACATPTASRFAALRLPDAAPPRVVVSPQADVDAPSTVASEVVLADFVHRDRTAFADRFVEEQPAVESAAVHPTEGLVVAEPPYKLLGGNSYTIAKLGTFMPAGDLDDGGLDDGLAVDLIFGHKLLPILSIEGSIGYITADGGVGNFEISVIPLFVNGRLSLPILIFEAYGGIGLGGMYADYEATGVSDSDFVFAAQAFIGLEVGLGNLAIGAEYRYVKSDDTAGFTSSSVDDFAIEGGIASIFISLPF